MNRTRLAILGSRGIPAKYGGFETFAEELSVRLARQGIDVTVFCESTVVDAAVEYKSVRLVNVPCRKLGVVSTIVFDMDCLWRARKGYDYVYMLGYGAAFFCFLPRIWGTNVWINVDGIEWQRSKWNSIAKFWFKAMEMLAMWTPNVVVADAEAIRQHLHARHRHVPGCRVIPYGAPIVDVEPDNSFLKPLGVESRAYYLIVCRMEPENHVKEIIAGFLAAGSRYPLLVVGNNLSDTAYIRELNEIADKRIHFAGAIFDSALLTVLRWHCRGYFHGHSVGGTNPSLLEALGCGNYVVAHDNPFNREVAATAGQYFTTMQDIPPLVAALDKVDFFDAQMELATARVRQKYTWKIVVDQYVRLLGDGSLAQSHST